jgi:hypothetical protein
MYQGRAHDAPFIAWTDRACCSPVHSQWLNSRDYLFIEGLGKISRNIFRVSSSGKEKQLTDIGLEMRTALC